MTGYLSLFLFLLSTVLFALYCRPLNRVEFLINSFCLMAAQIVISANILSYFEELNSIIAWLLAASLFFIISVILYLFHVSKTGYLNGFYIFTKSFSFNLKWFKRLSLFQKSVFVPLIGSVIILGLMNLFLVFNLAPGNHDSMTSHLARIAYYLQQGSYEFFEANYWGQVVHPRNSTSLFLYSYLMSGNENLTQIVQYLSYWIIIISIFGISRKAGMSKNQSLFSALISGLLISILMQATTTQNDLLLTALIGSIVYYFFGFKHDGKKQHLILASIAISISLGVKASIVLAMVPVAFIAVWCFNRNGDPLKTQINHYLFTGIAFIVSVVLFTLSSGYFFNIQKFGHPLGPEMIRVSHTFESESAGFIVQNGIRNTARYAVEFVSLDGLPTISPIRKAQKRIRGYSQNYYQEFFHSADSDNNIVESDIQSTIEYTGNRSLINYLMDSQAARAQFNYFKMPVSNEDFSYWGIFGFTLIWPLLFYSLFSKKSSVSLKILAIAAIIFFLLQGFSGPYDPWRGRYFNIAVIFATPALGLILYTKSRFLKLYLLLVIYIGCISAFSGNILKSGQISDVESNGNHYTFDFFFTKDRIAQLTRLGQFYEPVKAFNDIVPESASVAVYLPGDSHEYPLFGKNFTRTLYPINSFISGVQPIPENAEYLLYHDSYPFADIENDIHIGQLIYSGTDWYIRILQP